MSRKFNAPANGIRRITVIASHVQDPATSLPPARSAPLSRPAWYSPSARTETSAQPRAGLVRNFGDRDERTRRTTTCTADQAPNVAEDRSMAGFAEVKTGPGQEAVEQAGPVLHPPEAGLHQGGQLTDVMLDQVGQGPLEMGPHRLGDGSPAGWRSARPATPACCARRSPSPPEYGRGGPMCVLGGCQQCPGKPQGTVLAPVQEDSLRSGSKPWRAGPRQLDAIAGSSSRASARRGASFLARIRTTITSRLATLKIAARPKAVAMPCARTCCP
jgi:hypothetical protein